MEKQSYVIFSDADFFNDSSADVVENLLMENPENEVIVVVGDFGFIEYMHGIEQRINSVTDNQKLKQFVEEGRLKVMPFRMSKPPLPVPCINAYQERLAKWNCYDKWLKENGGLFSTVVIPEATSEFLKNMSWKFGEQLLKSYMIKYIHGCGETFKSFYL